MGQFKIVIGTELIGSAPPEKDPHFYDKYSAADYMRLLEDSQDYFTKIITGEISLDDTKYHIRAPHRLIQEKIADYIHVVLPDHCTDDYAISAYQIYVDRPIRVNRSKAQYGKYEYASAYGIHRFVAARGTQLKLLVYIED